MTEKEKFQKERSERIHKQGSDKKFKNLSDGFVIESVAHKYMYNFSWMGIPIIQYPQDMVAMQELIWQIKPDLIIETGIAHGGSIIYYASLLELIGKGEVLGIDIDIRAHNRAAIEQHPMFKRISMIEGSSISAEVINEVKKRAKGKEVVMVVLDSNHTHEHVLHELKAYASLVSINSYLIVFDTVVENIPDALFNDRPWKQGDNPKTAVFEFLRSNDSFLIDKEIENKLLITVAPDGFLKRIK